MIAIVDYGMGNLKSVSKAFEFISRDEILVTDKAEVLQRADRIVLPGVGSFGDAVSNLSKLGLIVALRTEVLEKKKPFLGICLGMQILAEKGFEHGTHQGLGFIKGTVTRFEVDLKVPHIGWNNIKIKKNNQLLTDDSHDFYFVHSYHLKSDDDIVCATCNYGYEFIAAIKKYNIFATQFHPEKSQKAGLQILKNFVGWSNA